MTAAWYALKISRDIQSNSLRELRYFQRELQELELSKIVLRQATKSRSRRALSVATSVIGERVSRSPSIETNIPFFKLTLRFRPPRLSLFALRRLGLGH